MYSQVLYANALYGATRFAHRWSRSNEFSGTNGGLKFGTYAFDDVIISNIPNDYDDIALDVNYYKIAGNGKGLSSWNIKDKTLTIQWRIIAKDQSDLEKKIDRLKSQLLKGMKILQIKRTYGFIQTQAVVSQLKLPRSSRTIDAIPVHIVFDIFDPFRVGLKATQHTYTDISWPLQTTLVYKDGTHPSQPIIYLHFSQAENVQKIRYKLRQKMVTVYTSVQAWDLICIDGERLNISKNGVRGIQWDWEFADLPLGEHPLEIMIDGNYTAEIFIVYKNYYV